MPKVVGKNNDMYGLHICSYYRWGIEFDGSASSDGVGVVPLYSVLFMLRRSPQKACHVT